jgi:tetratricopeptide (TPR) repeat protein
MEQLDNNVHQRIQALCEEGDTLAADEEYAAALEKYWAAWDLLPEPRTDWEAATWILGAIGDANLLGADFTAGRDNLSMAMRCPDAIGNPFLHLRLGQCEFELGNLDRAADELARAYMVEGDEIFEDEDPKYFAFLKTRLKPPPRGW